MLNVYPTLAVVVQVVGVALRSQSDLVIENVALRHQVGVLKRKRPRPHLDDGDRAFWVAMRTVWRGWTTQLVIVKPETFVKWRERFRRCWTRLSQQKLGPGRPSLVGNPAVGYEYVLIFNGCVTQPINHPYTRDDRRSKRFR